MSHLQRASQAVSIPAVPGGTRLNKALAPKVPFWKSFLEVRITHSGLRLFPATLDLQPKHAIPHSLRGIQEQAQVFTSLPKAKGVLHCPANCQKLSQHLWVKCLLLQAFPPHLETKALQHRPPPHSLIPQNKSWLGMLHSKKCISKRGLGAFYIPQEL